MNFSDPIMMLRWTVGLASVASLVVASELLAVWAKHQSGIFWRCCDGVMEERMQGGLLRGFHSAYRRCLPVILIVNVLAAVTTLIGAASNGSYREALYVLTVSSLAITYWRVVGGDGAQQMTMIILTACSFALLLGGESRGARPALFFIGGQGLLAYLVAGVSKAVSKEWRNEDVITKIASTVSYGNHMAVRAIDAIPGAGRALTLFVITFEMAMPLCLLVPPQVAMGFLGVALSFHLGCAVIMGLNDFVWAFLATYPAILYLTSSMNVAQLWMK